VDEDTHDPAIRRQRTNEQVLVDHGQVSTSALDVEIEGTNITLKQYYEDIRPPDLADLA
jgi:hypothetical protein